MSEGRKFLIAVLASIGVHLVLAALFCVLAGLFPTNSAALLTPTPDPKPMQVTVIRKAMPTPTPALAKAEPLKTPPPQNPRSSTPAPTLAPTPAPKTIVERTKVVLSSDGLTAASTAPKNTKVESDINSAFRSEKAGKQTSNMPSQKGRELDFTQFESKSAVPSKASPTPAAQPSPVAISQVNPTVTTNFFQPTPVPRKPVGKPKRASTPEPITVAKNTTPVPQSVPSATPTPAEAAVSPLPTTAPRLSVPAGLQHETIKTKSEGSAGEQGNASVAAVATPRGRYLKTVYDAIGSRWYYYVQRRTDLMMVGEVLIEFYVNEDGKIERPRILSNTANDTFATYCLQSVTEAQPPPIPTELASVLPDRRLRITYRFNLIPNQ